MHFCLFGQVVSRVITVSECRAQSYKPESKSTQQAIDESTFSPDNGSVDSQDMGDKCTMLFAKLRELGDKHRRNHGEVEITLSFVKYTGNAHINVLKNLDA